MIDLWSAIILALIFAVIAGVAWMLTCITAGRGDDK